MVTKAAPLFKQLLTKSGTNIFPSISFLIESGAGSRLIEQESKNTSITGSVFVLVELDVFRKQKDPH